MTIETDTTETDVPAWDEGLEDDTADDFEDDTETGDDDTLELQAARAELRAAEQAYRAASLKETFDRRVAEYRGMPESQRDTFLGQIFKRDSDRDEFVDQVWVIERGERIDSLVAGTDEALVEAYRGADELFRNELKTAIGDQDRVRAIVGKAQEHIVVAPTPQVDAEGKETETTNWSQVWRSSDEASMQDPLQVARQGLADVKSGRINADASLKSELAETLEAADQYPGSHPKRAELIERAAGISSYVREKALENARWTGTESTQQFADENGVYRVRETSQTGQTRLREPGEAETVPQTRSDSPAPLDPDSIRTAADAVGLTSDQWLKIDPERREQFLRAASEVLDTQHREGGQA